MAGRAFFLLRLNDHVQYLRKIEATLEDREDFQGTDYHECKLGRWLYGDGPQEVTALGATARAVLESILEPHRRFHEVSRLALERKAAADAQGARAAITEMHQLSAILVAKLLALDQMAK